LHKSGNMLQLQKCMLVGVLVMTYVGVSLQGMIDLGDKSQRQVDCTVNCENRMKNNEEYSALNLPSDYFMKICDGICTCETSCLKENKDSLEDCKKSCGKCHKDCEGKYSESNPILQYNKCVYSKDCCCHDRDTDCKNRCDNVQTMVLTPTLAAALKNDKKSENKQCKTKPAIIVEPEDCSKY